MIKLETIKINKTKQIHLRISLSIFKFTFFKLNNKFSIRIEISKGWD